MSKNKLHDIPDDHLDALVEEIVSINTERVFNEREESIKRHHEIGAAIFGFVQQSKVDASLLVDELRNKGCGSRATMYLSYQFYRKYPNIKDVYNTEHGKNISWNKVRATLQDTKKVQAAKVPRGCTQIGTLFDVPLYISTKDPDLLDQVEEELQKMVGAKIIKQLKLK